VFSSNFLTGEIGSGSTAGEDLSTAVDKYMEELEKAQFCCDLKLLKNNHLCVDIQKIHPTIHS